MLCMIYMDEESYDETFGNVYNIEPAVHDWIIGIIDTDQTDYKLVYHLFMFLYLNGPSLKIDSN